MKKIAAIILLASVSIAFFGSDSETLKSLIQFKLDDYATNNFPEKIYIHTDKPYYTAGESIWFSSYLVNGITHTASSKSFVMYVELIDINDSIIAQRKLFTEEVSVAGDIKLPQELKPGEYLLRGYTNYMRNQNNDYFFKKNITIYDSSLPDSQAINLVNDADNISENIEGTFISPEIGFYPEGGYLVNGITSRIAIKMEGQNITSSGVKGIIVDNDGYKITDFETFEFGLGSFYLKPETPKTYRAILKIQGKDVEYPLPTSLNNGYVLNTSLNKTDVVIKISTNRDEGLDNLLIIGHQSGAMAFDYTEKSNTKTTLVKIPKADLNEGVLEIAIFNKEKKPVAERLVFINKNQEAPIVSVRSDHSQISTREKVTLAVDVLNNTNASLPSTMSVSITDASTITNDINAENIKTWLLLNADLRGEIESPNYFFSEKDEVKKQYLLDLTMMTHGWRRFIWQELLENQVYNKYKPENGIYIKGNTLSTTTPYLNKVTNTKLTFKYEGIYQEEKTTDKNGVFSYGPFVYNDSIDVIVQATEKSFFSNTDKNSNTKININSGISTPKVKRSIVKNQSVIKNDNLFAYKNLVKKVIESKYKFEHDRELLEEVFIKTEVKTKKQIEDIARSKRTMHFRPTYRVVADDPSHEGQMDMFSLLLNLPSVRIGRDPGGTSNSVELYIYGGKPSIYLDNVKVTVDDIINISKETIDFIDVLKGPDAIRYPLEVYGVIAVFTKRGSREGELIKASNFGTISFKNPGFYAAKEFYAPDYSKTTNQQNKKDIRTTLHWEPKLLINGTNSRMSFYTSDLKGPYLIQVEGITNDGIPFHKTETFIVD